MKSLTPAQLILLDKDKSASQIAEITGCAISTVSRIRTTHHSSLLKPSGDCPCKLSPSDIHYSIQEITLQKAEHTTEITKTLQDITGEFISVRTGGGLFGQIRQKSIVWDQMKGSGCGKRWERDLLID